MEDEKYYRTLTRNMVVTVILVSMAPLLLIGAIVGYRFETSYRNKVVAHLMELVLKHQQNIDLFLNEKLSYIQVFANTFTFDQVSSDAFLANKLSNLQQAYGGVFVDLGVVDENGIQIAYAGTYKLERADYSQADWFKEAITRDNFISDVFLGLRRQPHFIVCVKQKTRTHEWLLRATIDFKAFNSLVESIHIGKTGSAFIINREGEFQTELRFSPELGRELFSEFLAKHGNEISTTYSNVDYKASTSFDSPQGGTTKAQIAVGTIHFSNRDYIYVMTPLKGGEWILAFQQDKADAFSDLYEARKLALLIILVGSVSIIFMAFFLSRKMVDRVRKADQEKEMMNEQVIETGKLASVGELAAGIAHEINNPIAIMVEEAGWMQDLLDEEELQQSKNLDEFVRALKQIETQGERCKEITHKLLSFARRTDPRGRDLLLNELIQELVSISEQRSKFSNVKITTNLSPDLPVLFASPSEVQQVLMNLINNAIDAIGTNGGTIDITTRVNDNFVIVDVADSGSGIPKAILPRIFDPFFTTKPVGKGTGLGLSICYGIIKKMGGEITVNSAVGMGTIFHIHFPLTTKKNSSN